MSGAGEEGVTAFVWKQRYRADHEQSIEDTWMRIARSLARLEPDGDAWTGRFYDVLEGYRFLPGGRIIANIGTTRTATLCNCFVMGPLEPSITGLFARFEEAALTIQYGGGIGFDFSTLPPAIHERPEPGSFTTGPLGAMRLLDRICATVTQTGPRPGAMMATLRCDHPDIEAFIDAKRDAAELRNFNMSVLVTDAFMAAVDHDDEWPLYFPVPEQRSGAAAAAEQPAGRVQARSLWEQIVRAAYDCAEPGVLFSDRINRANNLWYSETLSATNPCAEIPLPPYGACTLGSVNLPMFVRDPFGADADLDIAAVEDTVRVAVRMLDNVIDESKFAVNAQRERALATRRIGLGVTGLADAFMMLNLRYGSDASVELAARVMEAIRNAAYGASIALARDKGPFPEFDAERYLDGEFVRRLPEEICRGIRDGGIRNSHLLAVAPCGTISLLAGNVSSGIEPMFGENMERRVTADDGSVTWTTVADYACRHWRRIYPGRTLPPTFATSHELSPEIHLRVQAAIQQYVDNSVSKTINLPDDIAYDDVHEVFSRAYALGLKGCTIYRRNAITGAVLRCVLERRGQKT
jgi:ribonucleoside-diphosphate reductase alpha chain